MSNEWKDLYDMNEVAIAQQNGWEIEYQADEYGPNHFPWDGADWHCRWKYRGRPKQPKMVTVKSLCWRNKYMGNLTWYSDHENGGADWQRFPAGDLEGEVPE